MSTPRCRHPLSLPDLVDYLAGELSPADEDRVESHFFACGRCAERLEEVERLGAGVAAAVRAGHVVATVTEALLDRATGEGLELRQYRLLPGTKVHCTAAPADDFVVVRLAGAFGEATHLDLDVRSDDLDTGTSRAMRNLDVAVDRGLDEIVLLFPGSLVRTYPRSLWTMHVTGATPAGSRDFGTYVMEHTPWEQRPAS